LARSGTIYGSGEVRESCREMSVPFKDERLGALTAFTMMPVCPGSHWSICRERRVFYGCAYSRSTIKAETTNNSERIYERMMNNDGVTKCSIFSAKLPCFLQQHNNVQLALATEPLPPVLPTKERASSYYCSFRRAFSLCAICSSISPLDRIFTADLLPT